VRFYSGEIKAREFTDSIQWNNYFINCNNEEWRKKKEKRNKKPNTKKKNHGSTEPIREPLSYGHKKKKL